MIVKTEGAFLVGKLKYPKLSEKGRRSLLARDNGDVEAELLEMLEEADASADPVVLFSVCPVSNGLIGGVDTGSALVADKLRERNRVFPYIVTCGPKLEQWSKQYQADFLTSYWADEIKKLFLADMLSAFHIYLKKNFRITGHLTALNPGSLSGWPISGQKALFEMLGGQAFIQKTIGVTYSDSFLMSPTKTISGIAFESEAFYENCQYCPLDRCPNRRAKRLKEE